MTEKGSKPRNLSTITTIAISSIYLMLVIFYYHIDKFLTGAPFILLTCIIPLLFFALLFYLGKGLVLVYRNRKHLSQTSILSVIVSFVPLAYSVLSPWTLTSESLESKVLTRACFEGTQNQATIKFRADSTFEIHWTGAFAYNEWFLGKYKQRNDTFFLLYRDKTPYRVGDTLLNEGSSLITLNKIRKDKEQYFVPFYLGYCLGLN